MAAIFKKYLNLFAILWLAMNVAIASVPRCDSLLAFLKIHSHDQAEPISCHDVSSQPHAETASDPGQSTISAYDLCPCSISTFAYAILRFENPSDFITIRSLAFTPATALSPSFYEDHAPAIEPPYPKLG